MKKRKVALILGVTGQDGSFMARLLLKKNYAVHGLIRKSATGNLKNIIDIIQNKKNNFNIHHGDLLDFVSITNVISKIKPNLIGSMSVMESAQATKEPAPDPLPGPTGISFFFAHLI